MEFQEKPLKISRRDFLKKMAIGLGIVAGASVSSHLLNKELQKGPHQLKKEIEKKFHLELMTAKEVFEAAGRHYPEEKFIGVPQEWDNPRLKMLEKYLTALPPHFYAPDKLNNKLRIVLGKKSSAEIPSWALLGLPEYPHFIELSFRRFEPKNQKRALMDITHELVHKITPISGYKNEEITRTGGTFIALVEQSFWYQMVENIIGEKYLIFAPRLCEEVKRRQNYILDPQRGWIRDPSLPQKNQPPGKQKKMSLLSILVIALGIKMPVNLWRFLPKIIF